MNSGLLFPTQSTSKPLAILSAARALLPTLSRGAQVDARITKTAMDIAFNGTDANGAWQWKDAYDAIEVATCLAIRKIQHQVSRLEDDASAVVAQLATLSKLGLTHTRRSEEQVRLDQFSTPPQIAALAAMACQIRPGDLVLEPSAGTGLIAVFAEILGGKLHLNEYAPTRAGILSQLFRDAVVSRYDGRQISDLVTASGSFDCAALNPPFTDIDQHIVSAFRALADGGRLAVIVPAGFLESKACLKLSLVGHIRAMLIFPERAFAKHGTSVDTGLLVLDRCSPPQGLPAHRVAETLDDAIDIIRTIPDRATAKPRVFRTQPSVVTVRPAGMKRAARFDFLSGAVPVEYSVMDWSGQTRDVGLFCEYQLSRVRFQHSVQHPSQLVESAAMATTPLPAPSFVPLLPIGVQAQLSDPQKEVLVYAGQAHEQFLPGWWKLDDKGTQVQQAHQGAAGAFRVRRGFFCGDGTGVGKGRIAMSLIAAYIASAPLDRSRRAVFITKDEDLMADAIRDWTNIGGNASDIVPQSSFKLGSTIRMENAILFTTYATLRTPARNGKKSRLEQIIDWLGQDFDGPIVLDESHELANAMPGTGERGVVNASQQGLAGLLLQYRAPAARVTYLSATGATTPQNLAYACRLGLWGSPDAPFMTREQFMEAAENGGEAVLELICRELKAQGLYLARTLSFDGVEIDPLRHELTAEDKAIWAKYAEVFGIIHRNMEQALEATNGSANKNAKSAARSAFQQTSQRFFNNLLGALKIPTVIRDIAEQLDLGHACVIQIVTTNQAVLNRRLDNTDPGSEDDLQIDLSPKDAVVEYLQHAFPTELWETIVDDEGKEMFQLVTDNEGRPVHSQEALALKQDLLMDLALMPSIPGILDALVHHFGPEQIAEVTGRNRRVLMRDGRQVLERRSSKASLADTQAFMNGDKRILIFSDAGGTGKSYHADSSCMNTLRRVHYLCESGWRSTSALQGLGRTHRASQVSAPVFRPVTTDVYGEKRFISTISRRLASLGALTRGERRSAGNGLFSPEDNLENGYARRALVSFLQAMAVGEITAMSTDEFQEKTGLDLFDKDGRVREAGKLPRMNVFLNRLLSLSIEDQNALFEAFEVRLKAIIDSAREKGTLDRGVEDLVYENMEMLDERVIRVDATGAETRLLTFLTRQKRKINEIADMTPLLELRGVGKTELIFNRKSKRVGIVEHGLTTCNDKDGLERAVRIYRPDDAYAVSLRDYEESSWEPIGEDRWRPLWQAEVDRLDRYIVRTSHLATGLLLPVWKHLPRNGYVYRLLAPTGERYLGRLLDDQDVRSLELSLGLTTPTEALSNPAGCADLVLKRDHVLQLTAGLLLKRPKVMDRFRLEIVGNTSEFRALKALNCAVEIINHTARIFVPTDGLEVLSAVLSHYPVHGATRASANSN